MTNNPSGKPSAACTRCGLAGHSAGACPVAQTPPPAPSR